MEGKYITAVLSRYERWSWEEYSSKQSGTALKRLCVYMHRGAFLMSFVACMIKEKEGR